LGCFFCRSLQMHENGVSSARRALHVAGTCHDRSRRNTAAIWWHVGAAERIELVNLQRQREEIFLLQGIGLQDRTEYTIRVVVMLNPDVRPVRQPIFHPATESAKTTGVQATA